MHPTQKQADPVEVTPAFILRAAATYLQRHGWTQDDYYFNPEGADWSAACALGAIGMAVYGGEYLMPDDMDLSGWDAFNSARMTLLDHLIDIGAVSIEDDVTADHIINVAHVAYWNDEPEQTAEVVIATLRAAADDWDRIHGGAR